MLLWTACVHVSCQGSIRYSRCHYNFSGESVLAISTLGMYKSEETLREGQNAMMSLREIYFMKVCICRECLNCHLSN